MARQGLRVVAAASLLPALPLLLAHGIVSHSPVPATGLVPLAVSAAFSTLIYRRSRNARRNKHDSASSGSDHREQQPLLPNETPQAGDQRDHDDDIPNTPFDEQHPFLIFLCDFVLAAAILLELVFTWLSSSLFNGQLAMLAAYGTFPLILNLLIHLLFVIVPGECPGCGHHLRPQSTPDIPWLRSARRTGAAAVGRVRSLKASTMPDVSNWFRPAAREDGDGDIQDAEDRETGQTTRPVAPAKPHWLRRNTWLGYGAIRQNEQGQNAGAGEAETAQLFIDPESSRYRDDDSDDILNHAPARSHTPPEVLVVGKKKQRKPQTSDSSMSAGDHADW